MTTSAPVFQAGSQRLLLLFGAALLCACGQTGALYLPGEPADPSAAESPATEDSTESAEHQNKRAVDTHD